jgi:hypothetical protein
LKGLNVWQVGLDQQVKETRLKIENIAYLFGVKL